VKSLGADAAFDYRDPDCAAAIRKQTADSLTKVFDTISKDDSPKICADAMSDKGGTISCTLPYPTDLDLGGKNIEVKMVFTLGTWGVDFGYGEQVIPGNPDDFEFGKRLYDVAEKLLRDGKLKVHPPKISDTGLEGVLEGLEEVKNGRAGGVKLVYKL
jgi:NADPH:quinone reductase-like Zn-dependent oxidoreductase